MVSPFNANGRVKPDLALTCAAPIVTTLGCCCYLRWEYLGAATLCLFTRTVFSRGYKAEEDFGLEPEVSQHKGVVLKCAIVFCLPSYPFNCYIPV